MSYSAELKKNLKEMSMKKKCCRRSFFYGENLYTHESKRDKDADFTRYGYTFGEAVDSIKNENFKCAVCKSSFLRGIFCAIGTVSDPEKSFHLELKCSNEALWNALYLFLSENCVEMKKRQKDSTFTLYLKKSDDIEDFMHFMGAGKEAFEVANEKIKRNILNQANRRSNFEFVNIRKTVNAAQDSLDAIKKLETHGKLGELPKNLGETARLRIDNPFASLEELAGLHSDRISKSGVNHRLKKLIEIAEDIV